MAKRALSLLGLLAVLGESAAAFAQETPSAAGLEAGGLAPPGAGGEEPYVLPPSPEQDLRSAEEQDSGRGLEVFWVNGEAGVQVLGLQTFKANGLVDPALVETTQVGPLVGAGLGFRLLYLTLGPRFRYGNFGEWQLWTLDGELGLRIPIGRVEPYFLAAGGYASIGAVDAHDVFSNTDVHVRGWNLRGGVGLDLYLGQVFTVGGVVSGEALFLTRPGVDPAALASASLGADAATIETLYAADGSSIGAALTVAAVIGLHL